MIYGIPLVTLWVVLGFFALFGLALALQIALIRRTEATLRDIRSSEGFRELESQLRAYLWLSSEELRRAALLLKSVNEELRARDEDALSSVKCELQRETAIHSSSLARLEAQLEELRFVMSEFRGESAECRSSLAKLHVQMEKAASRP